ncbi:MAG: long-chain-acyl-CoA synthetase [Myxococcota bacterium]|nr:long-chain-acyl-CoA synthetase [Myxococcota bacterium]
MQLSQIIEDIPEVTSRVQMVVKKLPSVLTGLKYLKKTDKTEALSIGTYIEKNAELYPQHPAVLFENRTYSHSAFNAWVNRYANFLWDRGFRKGDAVAILLENRPEVLVTVGALAKIGAVASLINTNQRKDALVHSIKVTNPKAVVVGEELLDAYNEVAGDLELESDVPVYFITDTGKTSAPTGFQDLESLTEKVSAENPTSTLDVRLQDACFYIFTSGTTGLPKASIMTHFRWVKASAGFGYCALDLKPGEAIYCSLPLYHNNALTVAWSSASAGGAAMALRRKFSVSKFWDDTRKFNAVAICYIGELCRYLLNQAPDGRDADNPVVKVVGNGMRPDVWKSFKDRFGIDEVYEFYGASEGNIAFINLLNIDCTVGLCPLPYAIVKSDVESEAPVRASDGRFIKVARGETGLLIGQVTAKTPFDGYTNKEASEKKIFRDVFVDGDMWFNSGDLLKDMGYRHAQFVDRLGDTFRWKGENVSTTEVDEVCNGLEQVDEATTYGVAIPGTDGKAGMTSLVLSCDVKEFDLDGFAAHVLDKLPGYAVPRFIRLKSQLEITGTFKHRKGDLKKEGFDISLVKEPVYAMDLKSRKFIKVTKTVVKNIESGKMVM